MKICTNFLIAAALLTCSCSKSGIAEDSDPIETRVVALMDSPDSLVSSFEADKAMIEQMGYDTSDMIECGDNYLVGEDLIFSKEHLLEYRRSPEPEPQPRIDFAVKLNEKSQKIYVEVTNTDMNPLSFGQTPYMVKDAIKAWNEIGQCNLNIASSYDANPDRNRPNVNLYIGKYSDMIGGRGVFLKFEPGKSNDDACRALYINTDCREWDGSWNTQGIYLIMHGLGHVFRLKDVKNEGLNVGSIMVNHGELVADKYLWNGFSIFDINDLRKKYPILAPEPPKWDPKMEFSCTPKSTEYMPDWLTVGKTFRITTNYTNPALTNPTYEYSIVPLDSHAQCNLKKVGTSAVDLTFTAYGGCKLIVKLLENGVEKDRYEKTYYGVINKLTYDFGTMELDRFYDVKWEFWSPQESYYPIHFTVAESLFDNMSGKNATIETVENGHVRIRFNECGKYTITASVDESYEPQASCTLTFEKLYQPQASIRYISGYSWTDNSLPPTLNSTTTYNYEVDFGFPEGMPERVVADVYWTCTMHLYPYKKILVWDAPVKIGRVIVQKGESSVVSFSARGDFSRNDEGYIIRMLSIRNPYVSYSE